MSDHISKYRILHFFPSILLDVSDESHKFSLTFFQTRGYTKLSRTHFYAHTRHSRGREIKLQAIKEILPIRVLYHLTDRHPQRSLGIERHGAQEKMLSQALQTLDEELR